MLVNKTIAAKLAGVSRRTLYVHIQEKGITVIPDDSDGIEKIDVSELERVYGLEKVAHNRKAWEEEQSKEKASSTGNNEENSHDVTPSHTEIRVREQEKEIEKLNAIINVTEKAHAQRIEDLEQTIKEVKDSANSYKYLLEDLSKNASGEEKRDKSLKALENRIANQEREAKERAEKEQKLLDENKRIRQAYSRQKRELEEEKSKGFFKKLFG